jgi:hypothetical protein
VNARDILQGKGARYGAEPCCAIPLDQEAPDCPWHSYRSLMVLLADQELPEEVCARVLRVETAAQVHALEFVRRTLVATAQEEAAMGYAPMEITAKLVHRMNQLIQDVRK